MSKKVMGLLLSVLIMAANWYPSFFVHQTPVLWLQIIALMIAMSWANDW